MRYLVGEYGLVIVALCGCVLALLLWELTMSDVKEFSKFFVGNITGTYVPYGYELSLTDIENSSY
jgi:hypothetical protein